MSPVVCEVPELGRPCRLRGTCCATLAATDSTINSVGENRSGTEVVDGVKAAHARRMADAAGSLDRNRTATMWMSAGERNS
jgi:hypothetical protein